MLFAGIIGTEVGIRPFGYLTSMVMTIVLWLTLTPAIGAIARTGKAKKCQRRDAAVKADRLGHEVFRQLAQLRGVHLEMHSAPLPQPLILRLCGRAALMSHCGNSIRGSS
jgi:hypothetical protein